MEETITIHDSILIINRGGVLRRLWCPFPVIAIKSIEILHEGETHMVVSVRMGNFKLLYIIAGVVYDHTFFIILTK